jgi:predicted HNH restriction endonuclease
MAKTSAKRNVLVLWKYSEAEDCEGEEVTGSVGSQMRGIRRGDSLFICATRDDELFLLGSIQVEREMAARGRAAEIGSHEVRGKNTSGPFRILSMGAAKWQLRFESESDRLAKTTAIALQVRTRRFLTSQSANLLKATLAHADTQNRQMRSALHRLFNREGRRMFVGLSKRERDPKIRRAALGHHGRDCKICGMNFEHIYGRFAKECVQVHHLKPIGSRTGRGSRTNLADVIVVCPNCHYALHASDDASNWKALRRHLA